MKYLYPLIMFLLIAASAQQLSMGLWIYAKAYLAEALINHAWQQTVLDGTTHKPWSWADTWPVARLEIAKHGISQVVLSSATGNALAFSPGHIMGSGFPGAQATVMIAGHRDTHFIFLQDLVPGDKISLQGQDATYSYTMVGAEVVNSEERPLILNDQQPGLMLISCYPFAGLSTITDPGGPLRYVVYAVQNG